MGVSALCVRDCVCVCLSVCDHTYGTTRPIFTKFYVHVTYGCGLVLLLWRTDTLHISGLFAATGSGGAHKLPQRVRAEPRLQTYFVAF